MASPFADRAAGTKCEDQQLWRSYTQRLLLLLTARSGDRYGATRSQKRVFRLIRSGDPNRHVVQSRLPIGSRYVDRKFSTFVGLFQNQWCRRRQRRREIGGNTFMGWSVRSWFAQCSCIHGCRQVRPQNVNIEDLEALVQPSLHSEASAACNLFRKVANLTVLVNELLIAGHANSESELHGRTDADADVSVIGIDDVPAMAVIRRFFTKKR